MRNPPETVEAQANCVLEEWTNLFQQQIRTLIQIMQNPYRECFNNRGGHNLLVVFVSSVWNNNFWH